MSRAIIGFCILIAASSFNSAHTQTPHPAHTQTLYSIFMADTDSKAKGAKKAYKANLDILDKLVTEIKDAGFMKVEEPEIVKGRRFNCRAIAAVLNTYRNKLKKDDAVLFHYSGPGFQSSGKLPEFDCRRSWEDRNRVGLAGVGDFFKGRARLVVAMADTGNKAKPNRLGDMDRDRDSRSFREVLTPEELERERKERERRERERKELKRRVLQALFLKGEGVYKITAAKKGEDASFLVSEKVNAERKACPTEKGGRDRTEKAENDDGNEYEKHLGGAFTYQFLQAINSTWDVKDATWDKVLMEATRPIYLPEPREPTQTPYCER